MCPLSLCGLEATEWRCLHPLLATAILDITLCYALCRPMRFNCLARSCGNAILEGSGPLGRGLGRGADFLPDLRHYFHSCTNRKRSCNRGCDDRPRTPCFLKGYPANPTVALARIEPRAFMTDPDPDAVEEANVADAIRPTRPFANLTSSADALHWGHGRNRFNANGYRTPDRLKSLLYFRESLSPAGLVPRSLGAEGLIHAEQCSGLPADNHRAWIWNFAPPPIKSSMWWTTMSTFVRD